MTNFHIESWIWYGFTVCMVIARYTARWLHFKTIRRFQTEDWLMLFLTCLYTILIVFLNIVLNVNTNLIDPDDPIELTPQEISERTWGSKTILLVEQCMCAVQWGCKCCLLLLYWRLTQNLTQNLVVKCAAAYVITTYVVMEILYFAVWCRPFHDYWQTPTDNTQCSTALHHLITNLVFNLSSDVLIMSIPLPLLLRAHIEFKRKLLLIFPFSLGFFTIICAILSKHLSFTQPYSSEWVYWYCREASTAMIVTNMPYSWALIRRIFKLKSFFGDSSQDRVQGGHMQELQGHSLGNLSHAALDRVRQQSQAGSQTVSEKRKHSRPWQRSGLKKSLSASSEAPIVEEGRSPIQLGDLDKEVESKASKASTSESSAGSLRKPPNANPADSAAVDKLYRLDFVEDELERPQVAKRGYDG